MATAPDSGRYSARQPFDGVHARGDRLTPPGAPKDTRHHVISLAGSGIAYRPGDALGIWPANPPPLVDAILARLGTHGDEPVVAPTHEAVSLRDALLRRVELTNVSRRLLDACHAQGSAAFSPLLEPGQEAALKIYLHQHDGTHDVLDVLEDAPAARFAPQDFITLLRPMQPRLYSIASSLRAHPDEAHLLVVSLTYRARGRLRLGVGSTFLNERWGIGDVAPIYTQDSQRHFGMPPDPATPMIMIGPGTGVAPFRAFLEERAATGASGRNWLFFGDQSRSWAFYYQAELMAWVSSGLLKLDLAFSRDQAQKIYVQHRLREHGRDVYAWLEAGAEVFICGDKSRMAADVQNTLVEIVRAHGGRSQAQAEEYVAGLRRAGRLKLDVY